MVLVESPVIDLLGVSALRRRVPRSFFVQFPREFYP
jgi:hypothetical protein